MQNNKNQDNNNELKSAVANNNSERVVELLESTLFFLQQEYNDAFEEAILQENQEIQKLLMDYIKYSNNDNIDTLVDILFQANPDILRDFLFRFPYSSENIDLAISLLINQSNDIDKVIIMLFTLLSTNAYSAEGVESGLLDASDSWDGQNLHMIYLVLLDTKVCSLKIIKETLFDENGKLKQEFNYDAIKKSLEENYYLDKEILKKLNFTKEAKELSEKYQAQKEWSIEKYQKDYIKIHNTETYLEETYLDVNIQIDSNIMKLLAKLTQHHFGENNQNITHMILRYLDGNVDDTIKNLSSEFHNCHNR